jgi:ABC-type multidrug transport system ATPase subunit
MIELREVTKTFGRKRAVDRLDLDVRSGELFAFLGPNGAGKTTTIKMVCGLLAPNSGTVRVGGFAAATQEARQLIAYVPDQPYLYEKLTGREFLRFVVEMYGLDPRRSARRIAELIETAEAEAASAALPPDLAGRIRERMGDQPELAWEEALEEVLSVSRPRQVGEQADQHGEARP